MAGASLWTTGGKALHRGPVCRSRPHNRVPPTHDVGRFPSVGGVTFPWVSGPLRYTMNAEEAVELCGALDPTTIVPLHFEGWKHFRQGRSKAQAILNGSPLGDRVRWLPTGTPETLTI